MEIEDQELTFIPDFRSSHFEYGSWKAAGSPFRPHATKTAVAGFKVPNWLLKELYSSVVNSNINSSFGNRSIFLLTCRLSCFVSTPYISARSLSIITCFPRIVKIWLCTASLVSYILPQNLLIEHKSSWKPI